MKDIISYQLTSTGDLHGVNILVNNKDVVSCRYCKSKERLYLWIPHKLQLFCYKCVPKAVVNEGIPISSSPEEYQIGYFAPIFNVEEGKNGSN